MALGGGWTCIYIGDEDGVRQVKKEGEGVNLDGGQTLVDISESRLARHAQWFVVLILKPSTRWFGGFGLKTIANGFDWFGPQYRGVAGQQKHGGIAEVASRRSKVEKAPAPLDH
jgi:hypothetical protein